jgi:UDP-N-acetylglucosamine/UDP-N-acetylgalactosamine diphosphorylase
MTEREYFKIAEKYNQHHILNHYRNLPPEKQNIFLEGLQGLDFNLIFKLHKTFSSKITLPNYVDDVGQASIIPIPKTHRDKSRQEEARALGESLIRQNKIATLIVAGGQGSRLGNEGPKGALPITPIKKKPLFQLFAESVKAMSIQYHATIPLLIMTSHENHRDTLNFFNAHDYFGLDRHTVHFFQQSMLPSITPEGRLILKDKTHLFMNPDGHGGSLKALFQSGLVEYLQKQGISELFYCQVDNPLVKIADPAFIGYHKILDAEISTKVVRRRNTREKVGVYLSIHGRDAIIEYNDLSIKKMSALDENGAILYWAGNTAIHVLNLSFIERLNKHGFALPYHCAIKTVKTIGPDEKPIKTEAWKFETFVFDAIPLAKRTCCLEVAREEEFSPVKNRDGDNSPETARNAMNNLYRNWFKEAGIIIPAEIQVEISPLFALDKKELVKKIGGKHLSIKKNIYLG